MAELTAKGMPPVSGGTLEQSNWFMQAATFFWNEETRIENEKISEH